MADAKDLTERLRGYTDEELASAKADRLPGNLQVILADQEIARRDRLKQHELDLKLIADQVRWMKFSTILTAAATLIGAIVGAMLAWWLQSNPSPKQSEPPPCCAPHTVSR